PFYRPDDGNGSGGGDAPDNMLSDIEAAFNEVESGGGDGGAEGLGGGVAPQAREPVPDDSSKAGRESSDGQQAKTGREDTSSLDGVDRGDGRDHKGRIVPKDRPGERKPGERVDPQGDKSA